MKLYLFRITHSGRSGPFGKEKTDEPYKERLNTYCSMQESETKYGTIMIISHWRDESMSGEPNIKTMTLPLINKIEDTKHVILTTLDTVFWFRKT